MKVSVQKAFEKDIGKITDKKLASQVSLAIQEMENCKKLSELHHKKNAGTGKLLQNADR